MVPSASVAAESVVDGDHPGLLADLDATGAGEVDERGVELDARDDPGVRAVGGQGHDDLAPGGGDEDGVGDRRVRGQRADVEPEVVEQAQRAGGEAVAAGLVAGEAGLVDDDARRGRGGGLRSRRRPRPGPAPTMRTSTVGRPTVPTFRTGVPIAARIRSSGGATGSSARPERGATE